VYSIKGKQHLLLEDKYRVIESLSIVDFEFDRYSIYGKINGKSALISKVYLMDMEAACVQSTLWRTCT
jgi:hypothetical protein